MTKSYVGCLQFHCPAESFHIVAIFAILLLAQSTRRPRADDFLKIMGIGLSRSACLDRPLTLAP